MPNLNAAAFQYDSFTTAQISQCLSTTFFPHVSADGDTSIQNEVLQLVMINGQV